MTRPPPDPSRETDPERPLRAPGWLDGAEKLASAVTLVMLTNALLGPIFSPDQQAAGVGEAGWLRLAWLPFYGLTMALFALIPQRVSRIWPGVLGAAVLMAWPIASSHWSLDPETTQRRCLALVFTSLFGLYLAARFTWREIVELVATVYAVLGAMSLSACLAFPAFGIHHGVNDGDWKGVWYEKNALGSQMALGAIAALAAGLISPSKVRKWGGVFVLAVLLVLMSKSKTSLLLVLTGCGLAAMVMLLRRGPVLAVLAVWAGGMVGGLAGSVMWLAPAAVFKALGKDPTLTGRTDIWASLFRRVAERPWLGYGYQAFWSPNRQGPAAIVRKETKWLVPSAHNGWIDLLVQLGWVGVILFAVNFAVTAAVAVAGAPRRRDGGFALMFVAQFGLFSLSESSLLQHNSILWALWIGVMAKLFERAPRPAAAALRARAILAPPPGALASQPR